MESQGRHFSTGSGSDLGVASEDNYKAHEIATGEAPDTLYWRRNLYGTGSSDQGVASRDDYGCGSPLTSSVFH
jgi:hypothetical protein